MAENRINKMNEPDLNKLIEGLRSDEEAVILFGRHLSKRGQNQVSVILEKNYNEYLTSDYPDRFDCISSAAEVYKEKNGHYPESEEEDLPVFTHINPF
jgi:hypothetical protein